MDSKHPALALRLPETLSLLCVVARNDWLGSYPSGIGWYLLYLQEQGNVWKKSRTYSCHGAVLATEKHHTSLFVSHV
jgi:hypothetical protein